MTEYQIVWALYALGGLGGGWAAWLLFRRFGREWGLFFMVTVWVLTLTPFALDQESMTLAPAIFIYVMEGMTHGFDKVQHIALVVGGVWVGALVLALLLLLLASRGSASSAKASKEPSARDELLAGETPIRAER